MFGFEEKIEYKCTTLTNDQYFEVHHELMNKHFQRKEDGYTLLMRTNSKVNSKQIREIAEGKSNRVVKINSGLGK